MEKLHAFMTEQLQNKQVEPNSDIGKAYGYMLTRWDKLTSFLRKAGAPIENNVCERALKMAICHRQDSLFYRTQNGASIGHMFTSLIHTSELHGENPFEYLTAVLRHSALAAAHRAEWTPWTYKVTLARLSSR